MYESKLVLAAVDTVGIQNYVYATNNLQQNVGASHLVRCVTQDWALEELEALKQISPAVRLDNLNAQSKIEDVNKGADQKAEIIYAGGGKLVILFNDEAEAEKFSKSLTKRALLCAPGLRTVIAWEAFKWDSDSLGGVSGTIQKVFKKLDKYKASPPVSAEMLGLGVTAMCAYTGLPATGVKDGVLMSSESRAKRIAAQAANKLLQEELLPNKDYEFPNQFEELGATHNESSFIAVIHADGNGIGQRVKKISRERPDPGPGNREYIKAMRKFSREMSCAAGEALQETIAALIDSIEEKTETDDREQGSTYMIGDQIRLNKNKLPMRPIVFGGDDITLVCDGRLGLALAADFLKNLSAKEVGREPVHCRAGVAVVKSHFPFSRAYEMAEDLAASAKEYILEKGVKKKHTAMDWYFAISGLVLEQKTIRDREYTVRDWKDETSDNEDGPEVKKSLCMRPVTVRSEIENGAEWRTWKNFVSTVHAFQKEEWYGRRNKVKALREALRKGPDPVKTFLTNYRDVSQLPEMENISKEARKSGWVDGRCVYFDAIEAMDYFVSLKEG